MVKLTLILWTAVIILEALTSRGGRTGAQNPTTQLRFYNSTTQLPHNNRVVSPGTTVLLECRVTPHQQQIHYQWTCPNGTCDGEYTKVYNNLILIVATSTTGGRYKCTPTPGGNEASSTLTVPTSVAQGTLALYNRSKLLLQNTLITDPQQIPNGLVCTIGGDGEPRFRFENGTTTHGERNGQRTSVQSSQLNQNGRYVCSGGGREIPFYIFFVNATLPTPQLSTVNNENDPQLWVNLTRPEDYNSGRFILRYDCGVRGSPIELEYRSVEISSSSDFEVRRSRSCFVVGKISRVTVWFVSGGHISSTPAVVNVSSGEDDTATPNTVRNTTAAGPNGMGTITTFEISTSPNTTIIAVGGAVGGAIFLLVIMSIAIIVVWCALLKRRRKAARTGRISMVEDRHTQPCMTPHKQPHLIATTYNDQTICAGGESGMKSDISMHTQYGGIPDVKGETDTATTGGVNTQYEDVPKLNVKTGMGTATTGGVNTQYEAIVNMKSDFNMHTQYDEIPDVKGDADTAITGGINTQYDEILGQADTATTCGVNTQHEDVDAVLLKEHDHTSEGSTNTEGTRAKDNSAHSFEEEEEEEQQQQQDVALYTKMEKGRKKDKANRKDYSEQSTKGGALYTAVNKPNKGHKDKKTKAQQEGTSQQIARQEDSQQEELLYTGVNKTKKKGKEDMKGNLGAKLEMIELIANEQQQKETTPPSDTPTDNGLTYESSADSDDTQHQKDGEVNTTQPAPSTKVEGLYTDVDKTQKKKNREEE